MMEYETIYSVTENYHRNCHEIVVKWVALSEQDHVHNYWHCIISVKLTVRILSWGLYKILWRQEQGEVETESKMESELG